MRSLDWLSGSDLNRRRPALQAGALPTELPDRNVELDIVVEIGRGNDPRGGEAFLSVKT